MSVLGYLAKLKSGLGLAFGAYFLDDFSIKVFLNWFSINGKISVSHLISFSRYQTKCTYLHSWWRHINFEIFLGLTAKAMADTGKKRGRQKYKNVNISRTKRAF